MWFLDLFTIFILFVFCELFSYIDFFILVSKSKSKLILDLSTKIQEKHCKKRLMKTSSKKSRSRRPKENVVPYKAKTLRDQILWKKNLLITQKISKLNLKKDADRQKKNRLRPWWKRINCIIMTHNNYLSFHKTFLKVCSKRKKYIK